MPEFAGLFDSELRLEGAFDPASLVIEGWFDPDLIAGTLPVSASSGLRLDENQGLGPTAVESYEAPAGAGIVSQTAGFAWESVLGGIVQTVSGPEEAVQGLAATKATPEESVRAIAATIIDALEALQQVPATDYLAVLLKSNPTHLWKLNESSVSPATVADVGSAAFTLAVHGSGYFFTSGVPNYVTDETAPNFAALTTRGCDSASDPTTLTDDVTIACLLYWNPGSSNQKVPIYSVGDNASNGYGFWVHNGTTFGTVAGNKLALSLGGLDFNVINAQASGPAISKGGWHQAIAIRRGGTWEVWFDGTEYAGKTSAPHAATRVAVGCDSTRTGSGAFDGAVAYATVVEHALSDAELVAWINAGKRLIVAMNSQESGASTAASTVSEPAEATKGLAKTGAESEESTVSLVQQEAGADEALVGLVVATGEPREDAGTGFGQLSGSPIEAAAGIAGTGASSLENTLPVSETSGAAALEALQKIAASVPGPEDASGQVRGTKSEPWESKVDTVAVSQSAEIPVDADAGVAKSGGGPVEAFAPTVSATDSGPWEAGQGIAATKAEPWETEGVVVSVSQFGRLPLDATQKIRAVGTGFRWEAYAPAVAQTARAVVEALKKLAKTAGEPLEAVGASVAVSVVLTLEATQKLRATEQQALEALQGVFALAPDPHDNPGPVFNNSFMPTESNVRVEKTDQQVVEANQKLARTLIEQVEASGILRSLRGLPAEALAPGVAKTATAPYEVNVGAKSFVAVPLEAPAGLAAVAVLPIDARGHVAAKGFAIGIVLPATNASAEVIAGTSAELGDVGATEASGSSLAAAMAAARVLAASLSTIEDKEAGQP